MIGRALAVGVATVITVPLACLAIAIAWWDEARAWLRNVEDMSDDERLEWTIQAVQTMQDRGVRGDLDG